MIKTLLLVNINEFPKHQCTFSTACGHFKYPKPHVNRAPDGAPFLKHWYAINIKLSNYGHQFLIALSDYRISTQLGITLYV